jgi:cysteine desulfurase / selenocysteine lyase
MNFSDVKDAFPILKQLENGQPLVYLDSGATSQTPVSVIDTITRYYREENANVHRGVYGLSERATEAYEGARGKVRRFLNATSDKEIIFVRGTTEAINLVAQTWGRRHLKAGDEVVITEMEHHSNIVPWQLLRDEIGIKLVVVPMTDEGDIRLSDFEACLTPKTQFVSVVHMSNALGTINPVAEMVQAAKKVGAKVLLDGAQAVPHMSVDVRALDCDFYAFSGHKLYGPTGIGVLYGKEALLEAMPPYQAGGDMIYSVTFDKTEYNVLPYKFEAGTPNIAGAIGLGAAIDFVESIGLDAIADYEHELLTYATQQLQTVEGLRIIGTAANKGGVISFIVAGTHPHDMATLMDQDGIAVRASHHCAMPVMQHFDVPATLRASFGVYNTHEDIDRLVSAVEEARTMLV